MLECAQQQTGGRASPGATLGLGAGHAVADLDLAQRVEMGRLVFGNVPFDADLVVFDKDGTLIDFDFMWGRMAEAWVTRLTADLDGIDLASEVYHSLGYDAEQRRTLAGGPLEVATNRQLQTIVATVLYRHGLSWIEAEARSGLAFQAVDNLPLPSLVRPFGDLPALLERLRTACLHLAIVTTDDRAATQEALHILGIAHLFDHLVCGDDGFPRKPAPDGVLITCQRLGVLPARTAVVGDALADLLMARQAGAGLVVGVLSGVGSSALLAAHADVILETVGEIAVVV